MAKPSSYNTATQIFLADVVQNLFADNSFLANSRNASAFANNKTVNWNQAGAKPGVIINRDTTGLTPAKRVDILRNFELDEYQTQPTIIDWTEEYVTNYSKRSSVLEDHISEVSERLAQRILFNWSVGASAIIRTTGAVKAGEATGATGNRLAIAYADIVNARKVLNKQNIPQDNRAMLISANTEADILKLDEFKSRDKYGAMTMMDGAIGIIAGFSVFVRSSTTIFNNAATPVAQNPLADDTFTIRATAVTDNESTLFWSMNNVVRAVSIEGIGGSKVSIVPAHGADEFSLTLVAGGAKYRNGGEGIVALVEAASA